MSQAGVDLPPYGIVTVQLTTDPFPPLTTGTVHMTLRLQAPGGRTAPVDRVTYNYAPWTGAMCIRVKHSRWRGKPSGARSGSPAWGTGG